MRMLLNGSVMSVSTRYDYARKKAVTDVEMDVDGIEDRLYLEDDKLSGRSDLVGKPVRIILEVDDPAVQKAPECVCDDTAMRDTSLSCLDTVACDREALLAEAKEAEKSAWYFALDHDEDELRDRLTEAAEEFSDVARRIREACGEVGE